MSSGCQNGVLAIPEQWFWNLIGKRPGDPADDFNEVLKALDLKAAPGPGAPASDPKHYDITSWIDAAGNHRGRLSLPTAVPDELGYYTHTIQYVEDDPARPGKLRWTWQHLGGPPYAPRPCQDGPGSTLPSDPNNPLSAQVKSLQGDVKALSGALLDLAQHVDRQWSAFDKIVAEIERRLDSEVDSGRSWGHSHKVSLKEKK